MPREGTPILDDFVAGDTSYSMSGFVVHHQESIFKDHGTYKPKRWLGEEDKALQPFYNSCSTGARGCIGHNISYLDQTVLVTSLVHRETTNLSPGPMPWKMWKSLMS